MLHLEPSSAVLGSNSSLPIIITSPFSGIKLLTSSLYIRISFLNESYPVRGITNFRLIYNRVVAPNPPFLPLHLFVRFQILLHRQDVLIALRNYICPVQQSILEWHIP